MRLKRIAGRDQKPDLMQPQALAGQIGNVAVPRVRRIERSAKQANARAALVAEPGQRIDQPRVQGRTCPLPRTT